ncbi:MAG: hypothetical protein ACOX5Z_08075 [Desulfobulbus sp.]|jgi:hypothetical protein
MRATRFLIALGLVMCVFHGPLPGSAFSVESVESGTAAAPPPDTNPVALARTLSEQNRELRQIKRELALLNQQLDKTDIREIIAGIGFIFGLFGAGALASGWRRQG